MTNNNSSNSVSPSVSDLSSFLAEGADGMNDDNNGVAVEGAEAAPQQQGEGKARKPHTSPRFNAFNEVLAVIAAQAQSLDPMSDDYELVKSALDVVASEVEVLRDSPRPSAKSAPTDTSKMFVGVEMGTGVRTIFLSVSTPTKDTHGRQFAMVAGPFLNASKANKVLKDGISSDTKRVF